MVVVTSKEVASSGNTAPVWLQLIGEFGHTEPFPLLSRNVSSHGSSGTPPSRPWHRFLPGVETQFNVEHTSLGRCVFLPSYSFPFLPLFSVTGPSAPPQTTSPDLHCSSVQIALRGC